MYRKGTEVMTSENNDIRYDLNHLLDTLCAPFFLDPASICSEEVFNIDQQYISLGSSHIYTSFAVGSVRIDAYLPVKESDEISVVIRLKGNNALYGFTSDQVERTLLTSLGEPLEKRRFFIGYDKGYALLHFPNVTIRADPQTASDLLQALEILQQASTTYSDSGVDNRNI
jgi:hypothetical protein